MALDWFGYGYAALITIGGIVGYAKAGKISFMRQTTVFSILFRFGEASMCKTRL